MILTKQQVERLIVILLMGLLAFNYPLLAIFSAPVLWFGIPALFFYLFLFWAFFIGLTAIVMEKAQRTGPDMKTERPGKKD